jgi:negative regulator of sigma E activity
MILNRPMEPSNSSGRERRLDELFRAYREACPDVEPSANFMPNLWAKIETRQVSTNWFGRMAKVLVMAGLAASVILGMLVSSMNNRAASGQALDLNATFIQALTEEHASTLEPLHLDRISELEQQ